MQTIGLHGSHRGKTNIMTRLYKLAAATAALIAGFAVAPALAAPNAFVIKDADVLKNPTPASTVISEVDKGDYVTLLDCKNSFCLVKEEGGWVKQSALGPLNKGKPSSAPFSFSFGVGANGKPSFQIGVGNGGPGFVVGDDEEDEDPQVCFYKSKNFQGSALCTEPGDSDDDLPGSWDNAISSIEVLGGAEVLVCRDEDLEGACANITSSKKALPASFDNKISSYEVN
jgi:hypothetical protein